MAMQSYKTNALIEKIQLIVTKSKTIYKNGNYNGVSNQNLIDSGKLSAKDLENPFRGDFSILTSGNTTFAIEALNIPAEACVDMLTMKWSAITGIQLYAGDVVYSTLPSRSTSFAIREYKGKEGILFWFR